jgi:hypothetical protein
MANIQSLLRQLHLGRAHLVEAPREIAMVGVKLGDFFACFVRESIVFLELHLIGALVEFVLPDKHVVGQDQELPLRYGLHREESYLHTTDGEV